MFLQDVVKIKNAPIIGENVSYNIKVINGYCKEDVEKKCNQCKNIAFGNKKCLMNGRI